MTSRHNYCISKHHLITLSRLSSYEVFDGIQLLWPISRWDKPVTGCTSAGPRLVSRDQDRHVIFTPLTSTHCHITHQCTCKTTNHHPAPTYLQIPPGYTQDPVPTPVPYTNNCQLCTLRQSVLSQPGFLPLGTLPGKDKQDKEEGMPRGHFFDP